MLNCKNNTTYYTHNTHTYNTYQLPKNKINIFERKTNKSCQLFVGGWIESSVAISLDGVEDDEHAIMNISLTQRQKFNIHHFNCFSAWI